MINTTLCYIRRGEEYLMLHRIKKKHDLNQDKWIGIGGKFEDGESPEDCLLREAREETGLTLTDYRYRGIVTFVSDRWPTEYMHLFTADGFTGTLKECDEGDLEWIPKSRLLELPHWEGDAIFLALLDREEEPFFSLKLRYEGETLAEAVLNGTHLKGAGVPQEQEAAEHEEDGDAGAAEGVQQQADIPGGRP
jgi:8-oxo-dGTP diphosphatase